MQAQPILPDRAQRNARVQQHAGAQNNSSQDRQMNRMDPARPASPLSIAEGRLTISPDLAAQILECANYGKQRRVEKSHVATLADEMRRGQMLPGSQIAFGRLPDGTLHLVNGQHRLAAVIEAGLAQEFQVAVMQCADSNALDTAYYRFDIVQRKRSQEMVIRAAGIIEREGVRATVARGAYEAGVILACGLKRVTGAKLPPSLKTPDGKLEAVRPFWPQVRQFQKITEHAETMVKLRLLNGSVMAVAVLTLRDQIDRATPFWLGIAENSGLEKGDPRRTLVMALVARDFHTLDAALLLCANAWNAWYSSRSLTHLKVLPGSVPVLRGVKMPR